MAIKVTINGKRTEVNDDNRNEIRAQMTEALAATAKK